MKAYNVLRYVKQVGNELRRVFKINLKTAKPSVAVGKTSINKGDFNVVESTFVLKNQKEFYEILQAGLINPVKS